MSTQHGRKVPRNSVTPGKIDGTTRICRQQPKNKPPWIACHNIVGADNPDQFNGKSATFVEQNDYKMFPNVFTGLGNLGVPYDIHLKEGSQIPQIEFHCRYEKNLLKLSST